MIVSIFFNLHFISEYCPARPTFRRYRSDRGFHLPGVVTKMFDANQMCLNDKNHSGLAKYTTPEEAEDYIDHLRYNNCNVDDAQIFLSSQILTSF